MTRLVQFIDEQPIRVSLALTAVLAVIELALVTWPGTVSGWLTVLQWLPWAGALVGGLVVRSWWWLLIYPLGCLAGLITLVGWNQRQGDASTLSAGVGELAIIVLPLVVFLAAIGPLYASLFRRFNRRTRRQD